MKALIIFGSPRKNGNTASLLKAFSEELVKHGCEIEVFDVYEKNIAGCKVCLNCQKEEKISCCIEDDMQPILHAVGSADLIVIAAPVYVWSVPAPVKAVLDRLVYASCRYYGEDPHGPALLKGKRLALITTCGYPVHSGADLLIEAMQRYCRHCGILWKGALALRHKNLKAPFMDAEKRELAENFARELTADSV